MRERTKWLILIGVTFGVGLGVVFLPRIPQWASYNQFADERNFMGIPNFWDVISNFPFLIVACLGFFTLRSQWKEGCFKGAQEIFPYIVFFIGVLLTGLGSSYYHWAPDNSRLAWDRLPMTIIFMSLVSIVLTERTNAKIGYWVLWPLLALGVGSVTYWSWTESLGRGDLGPYGFVQFYPPVLIALIFALFPRSFPSLKDLLPVAAFYLLAKAFEFLDGPIYQFTGFMSGHALKHLAAAMSVYWIWVLLQKRERMNNLGG